MPASIPDKVESLEESIEELQNNDWKVAKELADIKVTLSKQDTLLVTLLAESNERKTMTKTLVFIGKMIPVMLAVCVTLLGGLMWLIQHA